MLLNSTTFPHTRGEYPTQMGYPTETLLEDVAAQMAGSSLSRRLSRGSTGPKGGSSRVTKPSSTGLSPRNSVMLNRRKTVMSGSPHPRRPQLYSRASLAAPTSDGPNDNLQVSSMASRPLSWHASSQLQTPVFYPSTTYSPSPYGAMTSMNTDDALSTPAVYSGYTTPAWNFSPLSQPLTTYPQASYRHSEQPIYPIDVEPSNNQAYTFYQPSLTTPEVPNHYVSQSTNMDPTMYSHFDWDNCASNGFDTSSSPPTPDNFLPVQQPELALKTEERIPLQPLEDDEPGEVLIGMGLYDAPEKAPEPDVTFDTYRAYMMSQLLGTPFKKPEPTVSVGKGLKLEETWSPPTSEADEYEDAEGEDEEDEEAEEQNDPPTETTNYGSYRDTTFMNGLDYARAGWV